MDRFRWVGMGLVCLMACGPSVGEDGEGNEGTGGDSPRPSTGSLETGGPDGSGGQSDSPGNPVDNACGCTPEPDDTQLCESDELAQLAPGCGFEDEAAFYEIDCVLDDMNGTQDAVLTCTDGDAEAKAELITALQSDSPAILVVTTEIFAQELSMDAYMLDGDGTGTKIDCDSADSPPAQTEVSPSTFMADGLVECLELGDVAESVGCVADVVTLAEPLATCE